jgi:hypothetical protein
VNERIQELALQATELDYTTWDSYNHKTVEHYKFNREKFAELIVRQCAKIAVFKDSGTIATADVAGHMAAGRSIAARLIKEHFGVEE